MPSKSHTIRFTSLELDMIERYRANRRMSFGAAVKELMHIGDHSLEDRSIGKSFEDFIDLSKKLQIETLLLLRHYLHKEHRDIYARVKQELKDMLED